MRYAVVTDTNSGFTSEEAKKHGIELIPMPVIIDDQTRYEGVDIDEATFTTGLLPDKKPRRPNPLPGMSCGSGMRCWKKAMTPSSTFQ